MIHVITKLEPNLFKRVTGLSVEDFELLVSLHVFNGDLMNDAIYKFKRYEDNSLRYTGIDRHAGQSVGGWDTVMDRENYDHLFAISPNDEETKIVTVQESIGTTDSSTSTLSTPLDSNISTEGSVRQVSRSMEQETVEMKKTDVDIDVSIGSIVIHKVFGEGTVIQLDKVLKHVRISFANGEKTFIFPDAFNCGFLNIKP